MISNYTTYDTWLNPLYIQDSSWTDLNTYQSVDSAIEHTFDGRDFLIWKTSGSCSVDEFWFAISEGTYCSAEWNEGVNTPGIFYTPTTTVTRQSTNQAEADVFLIDILVDTRQINTNVKVNQILGTYTRNMSCDIPYGVITEDIGNRININMSVAGRPNAVGYYNYLESTYYYDEYEVIFPDDVGSPYIARYYPDEGVIYWNGLRGYTSNKWWLCPLDESQWVIDLQSVIIPGEASGQTLIIDCDGRPINIVSAVYSANCDTTLLLTSSDQTIALQYACNLLTYCEYYISHLIIGDPAIGCSKDYRATYYCGLETSTGTSTYHLLDNSPYSTCRGTGWDTANGGSQNMGYLTQIQCENECNMDVNCTGYDISHKVSNQYDCYLFYHPYENYTTVTYKDGIYPYFDNRYKGCWRKDLFCTNGGTEQLILDLKDVNNGLFDSSMRTTGVENPNDPLLNTYSIVGNLDSSYYIHNDEYEFYLTYNGLSAGYCELRWKQSMWLTSSSVHPLPGFTEVNMDPPNIATGGRGFYGLGYSDSAACYLDGTGIGSDWYNCIGAMSSFAGGIASYGAGISSSETLYACLVNEPEAKYFIGPEKLTQTEGEAYCNGYQTHLASIHSWDDFYEIINVCEASANRMGDCWTGGYQTAEGQPWQYYDGTPTDYGFSPIGTATTGVFPWDTDQPNNWGGDQDNMCLSQDYDGEPFFFNDCANWNVGYPICNVVDFNDCAKWMNVYLYSPTYMTFMSGSSLNGIGSKIKTDALNQRTYVLLDISTKGADADQLCMDHLGTHLATIYSKDDNERAFIQCAKSTIVGRCWIGLTRDGASPSPWYFESEGGYIQPLGFTNWDWDQPGSGEKCVALWLSPIWHDVWCTESWPVVCDNPSDNLVVDAYTYAKNDGLQRGHNVVVFNELTGKMIDSVTFDTWVDRPAQDNTMKSYLNKIDENRIVAITIHDTGETSSLAHSVLQSWGCNASQPEFREPFVFIGTVSTTDIPFWQYCETGEVDTYINVTIKIPMTWHMRTYSASADHLLSGNNRSIIELNEGSNVITQRGVGGLWRGHSVAVFNEITGELLHNMTFDTATGNGGDTLLANFLNNIDEDRIVAIVVTDTGEDCATSHTLLQSWGCAAIKPASGEAFVFVGTASTANIPSWQYCQTDYPFIDVITDLQICAISLPPTSAPTQPPSNAPSFAPTQPPSLAPSLAPSIAPSLTPTTPPSAVPSLAPSINPTLAPSATPTTPPTGIPTLAPSLAPSKTPTQPPSSIPTLYPSLQPTLTPSITPTQPPSLAPSINPSLSPSLFPSIAPSIAPSINPSIVPSLAPTGVPTFQPGFHPTWSPTLAPSIVPSLVPSISPSNAPSINPTIAPSINPSLAPSLQPSIAPSINPSIVPSLQPSIAPSLFPSIAPSLQPSLAPSIAPSLNPSNNPSKIPTNAPSIAPTQPPSSAPTLVPSLAPSITPTQPPTLAPTLSPTWSPTPKCHWSKYKTYMDSITEDSLWGGQSLVSENCLFLLVMEKIGNLVLYALQGRYVDPYEDGGGRRRLIIWWKGWESQSKIFNYSGVSSPNFNLLDGKMKITEYMYPDAPSVSKVNIWYADYNQSISDDFDGRLILELTNEPCLSLIALQEDEPQQIIWNKCPEFIAPTPLPTESPTIFSNQSFNFTGITTQIMTTDTEDDLTSTESELTDDIHDSFEASDDLDIFMELWWVWLILISVICCFGCWFIIKRYIANDRKWVATSESMYENANMDSVNNDIEGIGTGTGRGGIQLTSIEGDPTNNTNSNNTNSGINNRNSDVSETEELQIDNWVNGSDSDDNNDDEYDNENANVCKRDINLDDGDYDDNTYNIAILPKSHIIPDPNTVYSD